MRNSSWLFVAFLLAGAAVLEVTGYKLIASRVGSDVAIGVGIMLAGFFLLDEVLHG